MASRSNTRRRALAALAVAFVAVGCASFRGGVRETESEQVGPGAPDGQPSIALFLNGLATVNGAKRGIEHFSAWRAVVIDTYRKSRRFSRTQLEGQGADLRAHIVVTENGQVDQAIVFLSGLTLGLIPARATSLLHVSTTLLDAEGNEIGSYASEERLTTWYHLLMLFAMPSRSPNAVFAGSLRDLNLAILRQAFPRDVPSYQTQQAGGEARAAR